MSRGCPDVRFNSSLQGIGEPHQTEPGAGQVRPYGVPHLQEVEECPEEGDDEADDDDRQEKVVVADGS